MTEIPKITFNDRVCTSIIYRKTFGLRIQPSGMAQQSRAPYTAEQIVNYLRLSSLGGPKGICTIAEFFLYSKKDRGCCRKMHGARI